MEEHQFQGEQFRDPVIRRQAACRCNGYRCTECMLLEIRKSMRIVIFGANGPTGRILTKQALDAGHKVVAVTRHPEAFPLHHERLQVMRGDVLDLASVEQAVAGQDAVLSTIGAPFSRKPITVNSQGTANMIQAMNHHGFVALSLCVRGPPIPTLILRKASSLEGSSNRSSGARSMQICLGWKPW
jgi:putative NAD(P)-binding protein